MPKSLLVSFLKTAFFNIYLFVSTLGAVLVLLPKSAGIPQLIRPLRRVTSHELYRKQVVIEIRVYLLLNVEVRHLQSHSYESNR